MNSGPERCGSYQAAWDASLGLDRLLPMAAVRVLDECDQPPITTWLGSGICGDHLLVQLQRATHDHLEGPAWTLM